MARESQAAPVGGDARGREAWQITLREIGAPVKGPADSVSHPGFWRLWAGASVLRDLHGCDCRPSSIRTGDGFGERCVPGGGAADLVCKGDLQPAFGHGFAVALLAGVVGRITGCCRRRSAIPVPVAR
jgi:hypothetical protein